MHSTTATSASRLFASFLIDLLFSVEAAFFDAEYRGHDDPHEAKSVTPSPNASAR
jgi:hypothetical protein